MDFVPHTEKDIKEMMRFLGISSFDELFDDIPDEFKVEKVGIGEGMTEMEIFRKALAISSENKPFFLSLAGLGVYYHYVPAICDFVSSLPGFFTSYTPYQAEMSQGIMKVLFDFQSLVAELFAMDVSNAGMYGGASALAEACLMSARITGVKKIHISAGVNPIWLEVVRTYLDSSGLDFELIPLDQGRTDIQRSVDVLVVQYPNFLGVVEDLKFLRDMAKKFFIVAVPDPVDMAYLPPPGDFGADVVVSEGQPLGNYPYFGGAKLGIFLTKKDFMRSMPGRIIGETEDVDGKTCYAMILQTREQHIRREKATSNICTSSVLLAVRATAFMKYYGAEGLFKIASLSHKNANSIGERFKPIFPSAQYFKEFPSYSVDEDKFFELGILPPVRLSRVIPNFLDVYEYSKIVGFDPQVSIFCATEIFNDDDINKIKSLL